MAKPRSHIEITHRFCNGYRDHVHVRDVSIRNDTLYSYQMPIGRYIGGKLVIRNQPSTHTTNKHLSKLRCAARGQEVIYPQIVDSHCENERYTRVWVSELLSKSSRAISNGEAYLNRARHMMEEANKFSELCGFKPQFDIAKELSVDLTELKKSYKAARKLELARKKLRAEELAKANAEILANWREDLDVSLPWGLNSSVPCMLRVRGNTIETSYGATIPLDAAPPLWKMVKRAMAKHNDYEPGYELGYYRLSKIHSNGDIQVGCHDIEFEELKLMAVKLGLEL